MNPLLPAAVAAAVLLVAGLATRQAASPGPVADQALLGPDVGSGAHGSPLERPLGRLALRLAPAARRVLGGSYARRMRHGLLKAGSPKGMGVDELLGRKLLTVAVTTVLAIALAAGGSVLLGVAVLVVGLVFHDAWLASLAADRRSKIERDLPDLLDVLAVTLTAGVPFRPGLGRVVVLTTGPLAQEMTTTLREIDFGVSRRGAFQNLRYRTEGCEPVSDLVAGVLQAEELGVPLVEAVVDLTADLRRSQEQNLRRRVARVEARITAVMTLMVLPASIVLIAAGLWLSADVDLGSVIGG